LPVELLWAAIDTERPVGSAVTDDHTSAEASFAQHSKCVRYVFLIGQSRIKPSTC